MLRYALRYGLGSDSIGVQKKRLVAVAVASRWAGTIAQVPTPSALPIIRPSLPVGDDQGGSGTEAGLAGAVRCVILDTLLRPALRQLGMNMFRMARFLLWMMLALGVFGYGIGVGRYRWPPWNTLAAGFHLVRPPPLEYSSYQDARAKIFASSKARPDVVMLGDSLTEFGIWSEMLEDFSVVNRGISGDDSVGVLRRLPEVLGRKPRVICLEIGINDLFKGVPTERVIENVRAIATAAVQAGSLLILQSVPFAGAGYGGELNQAVKRLLFPLIR
jgi:hypothetical protein